MLCRSPDALANFLSCEERLELAQQRGAGGENNRSGNQIRLPEPVWEDGFVSNSDSYKARIWLARRSR